MSTVYILTREVNAYDQYGRYFVCWWPTLPSKSDLAAAGIPADLADHVLKGGGRRDCEEVWWHLDEVKSGEVDK